MSKVLLVFDTRCIPFNSVLYKNVLNHCAAMSAHDPARLHTRVLLHKPQPPHPCLLHADHHLLPTRNGGLRVVASVAELCFHSRIPGVESDLVFVSNSNDDWRGMFMMTRELGFKTTWITALHRETAICSAAQAYKKYSDFLFPKSETYTAKSTTEVNNMLKTKGLENFADIDWFSFEKTGIALSNFDFAPKPWISEKQQGS